MESAATTSREAFRSGRELLRRSPARGLQLLALLVGLVLGVIALLALNFGLSYAIWGELAVALTVLAVVIFGATHVRDGWLIRWSGVEPLSVWQSFAWAFVVIAGIPLAWTFRWWWGPAILVVPAFVIWLAQRKFDPDETTWLGVLSTKLGFGMLVGALLLVAYAVAFPKDLTDEPSIAPATKPLEEAGLLAWQFRPRLFFDSAEQFIPIDIEDAIDAGRIKGCERGVLTKADPRNSREAQGCKTVVNADGFAHELDYVSVEAGPLAQGQLAGGPGSAIYYHVSRRETGRIFIDYWWYFVENPSPVFARALCGAATSWVPKICGQHASDWEGMTVVLGRCGPAAGPAAGCFKTAVGPRRFVEAHYAQHEHTHAYTWAQLQESLRTYDNPLWSSPSLARPRVFVARSSHASYRIPCAGSRCSQSTRKLLTERRNGLLPWANNDEPPCIRELEPGQKDTNERFLCLKPLPVNRDGEPSKWNAYGGRWGTQKCVLSGTFCDGEQPPRGPAFQGRYKNPAAARQT
jgi:hypothetical protein